MLARALTDLFGSSYSEGVLIPGSLRELQLAVRTLREHDARPNQDVRISREKLVSVGTIDSRSAILDAEAGVSLEAIEAGANTYDLGLGFLSPASRALTVGEFLEGPYAGLRPIPGGRLEPLSLALRVVLPEGDLVAPQVMSPRSAAGPELAALHLGAGGAAGLIVGATLRLMPRPRTRQVISFSFPDAPSLLSALRRALSDGCAMEEVRLARRASRFVAQVHLAGSPESVERDAKTVSLRVAGWSGRPAGHALGGVRSDERELSWDDVGVGLVRGQNLSLHRLSLDALIACGAGELGQSLSLASAPAPSPELEALYALLDPNRVTGDTV